MARFFNCLVLLYPITTLLAQLVLEIDESSSGQPEILKGSTTAQEWYNTEALCRHKDHRTAM